MSISARNNNNKYPFVSVIIPVFNSRNYLKKTLKALDAQTFPKGNFEIIVIDNGSTDGTLELLDNNILFLHNEKAKNPYISRNRGVERSKGQIIAFLDVSCTPVRSWLREGVKLIQDGADLVGGEIEFKFSSSRKFGEWYDSITFVDVEKYIDTFGSAVGGNLFINRKVWSALGPFPEDMRSGADSYWTKKASQNGFNLVFGKKAKVYYPARGFLGVMKKSFRVGIGHTKKWIKEKKTNRFILLEALKTFSPPSFTELSKRISKRGKPDMEAYKLQLWIVSWFCKISMATGRIYAILFSKLAKLG